MKNPYLVLLAFFPLLFSHCSTDVDLIAPYQETTVVYGLLNPADSVQYIRVAKAFLGEGNALVMAGVNDSIYYPDSVITVVLQRWKNGILLDSTLLVRDETIQKETGIFSNQPNVLYRTVKDPVNHTDSIYKDCQYRIRIHNKYTGNEVTSTTGIVGDISVTIPSPNPAIKLSMTASVPSTVKWYTAVNGKVYNLVIRFFYEEKLLSPPNTFTVKSADWTFSNVEVPDPRISVLREIEYIGEDFYKNLAAKVQPDNTVERKPLFVNFVFTIGAEEFYSYYLVNQPSLTINQEIPQYTNINNGIGIFSSRNIYTLSGKQLDVESLDSLRNGRFTGGLSFL